MAHPDDRRLEIAMGNMLRMGVIIAALVVLVGGVLYLIQFRGPVPDYQQFHGASASYESVPAIIAGVRHLDSQSVIGLGILLLIATPVCRVIFGLVGFSIEKDKLYAAISAIVLLVLLMSFFAKR